MAAGRFDERFLASTRGQIVALLRRADRTVDELAQALDLTGNAVRAHLATLERDGLVQQTGVRRGAGKPAYVYALTPQAEQLFPKPYGLLLNLLLETLSERLPPEALEGVLQSVGRRLAAGHALRDGDLRRRLERALPLVDTLGGLAELQERDGTFVIQGYSCPLAAVVADHPEACRLVKTFLAEVIGAPVREQCERGEQPRCRFEAQA